jgi:hypothetical protein
VLQDKHFAGSWNDSKPTSARDRERQGREAVNILKWIRKHRIHATAQPAGAHAVGHFTAPGSAIEPEWRSRWLPDDSGFFETRRHVGQSAEGFHAGIEVAQRVCDRIVWSDAYPTPEKAREGASEMERRRRQEIEKCPDMDRALGQRR